MSFFKVDVKRIISLLFIFCMIVSTLLFAYLGREMAAGLSIVVFSFGLVFLNLDKFSKFKGAGFEAELKEVVTEAYAAIEDLRKVAINVSKPAVSLLAVRGPFQYLHLKFKLEYAKNISGTLSDLNISAEKIEYVLSALYERVEEAHRRKVLVSLNEKLITDDKVFNNYNELNIDDWNIEKIIRLAKSKSIDISNEFDDYNHFISYKTLRSPEDWQG